MKRAGDLGRYGASAVGKVAAFFTLILACQAACEARADDNASMAPIPMISGQPADSPLDVIDKHQKIGLLLDYVRKQAPGWAPGLRDVIRSPYSWVTRGLKPIGDAFGGASSPTAAEERGYLSQLWRPVSALMEPPPVEQGHAMWLTPSYHHKGFMPFHDAMIMGVNLRHRMLSDELQFDVKPFYGQNWVSLDGYGGIEMGVGIGSGAIPWGRIAVRYIDGASNMMDRSRGLDMSAQLRFSDRVSLDAGLRGDENTELGDYVMIRCTLMKFGN